LKIHGSGGLTGLIQAPKTGARTRESGKTTFEEVLKGCQASGGVSSLADAQAVKLAASSLDLLDEIARKLDAGVGTRELAPAHERLARQAAELSKLSEGLPGGPLKEIATETSALSYVQLWRFENGEF